MEVSAEHSVLGTPEDAANYERDVASGLAAYVDKLGDETPETGTPHMRSLSPSSDGSMGPASNSGEGRGAAEVSTEAETNLLADEVADEVKREPESSQSDKAQIALQAQHATSSALTRGNNPGTSMRQKAVGLGTRLDASQVFMVCPVSLPLPGSLCQERKFLQQLAAPVDTHRQLSATAKQILEFLRAQQDYCEHAFLYGSLALEDACSSRKPRQKYKQDWPSYYVNGRSDVDVVVAMMPNASSSELVDLLLKQGRWQLIARVQVHKFDSTQFTLLGSCGDEDGADSEDSKVFLDLTCIENKLQVSRFRNRQEAFRRIFVDSRFRVEAQLGPTGALAFDTYIHMLKAFARNVPENSLTGFQATCIGLFSISTGEFQLRPDQTIAMSLFEGFLRFCVCFYGAPETTRNSHKGKAYQKPNYQHCTIDLTASRFLPRLVTSWPSELYFLQAEERMMMRPEQRMNVTHSLDPGRVCNEALVFLARSFIRPRDPPFAMSAFYH